MVVAVDGRAACLLASSWCLHLDPIKRKSKSMTYFRLSIFLVIAALLTTSLQSQIYRDVDTPYGIRISVPSTWEIDSAEMMSFKLEVAQMLKTLDVEGKIRLINAGPRVGLDSGYARVRLNILKGDGLTQEEAAQLDESDMIEVLRTAKESFSSIALPGFDLNTMEVRRIRSDEGFSGFQITYIRPGLNGPVRVEQNTFPFANRSVQLTLSYEIGKKSQLQPILIRIMSSLSFYDTNLWPATKK